MHAKQAEALLLNNEESQSANNEIFYSDNGQIRSHDDAHRILFRREENIMEFREYGGIIFSAGSSVAQETNAMNIQNTGSVGIGVTEPTDKLEVDGVINVHNNNITNLADPVYEQDAVTKSYLDSLIIGIGSTGKLLAVGYPVEQLLDGGHSVSDLVTAEVSVFDLVAAGATTESDYIGLMYEGGIIFYVNTSNGTGLVSSLSDQSTTAEWGCYGTEITGANGTAIGTGKQNTIDIEAGCTTAGTAADICSNLNLNGYDDWFLPSKDELNLMYQNKATIDATATANGGSAFGSACYWSSSETSGNGAWKQYLNNGGQYAYDKDSPGWVRTVRTF